jgi:hypothetical protein
MKASLLGVAALLCVGVSSVAKADAYSYTTLNDPSATDPKRG